MKLKELKFLIFLWSCLIVYTVVLTSLIPSFLNFFPGLPHAFAVLLQSDYDPMVTNAGVR